MAQQTGFREPRGSSLFQAGRQWRGVADPERSPLPWWSVLRLENDRSEKL